MASMHSVRMESAARVRSAWRAGSRSTTARVTSASSAAPALIAWPAPQTFQTEGRPRLSSSPSWTSSNTSEKLCTSSTATAAQSASAYRLPKASQVRRARLARSLFPDCSRLRVRPRWYWTISVSNAL